MTTLRWMAITSLVDISMKLEQITETRKYELKLWFDLDYLFCMGLEEYDKLTINVK